MSSVYKVFIIGSIAALMAATAVAQTEQGYNSIPKPVPGNVPSEGFECCGVQEFGDGVQLVSGGSVGQVSVVMSSWACQAGQWTSGCVTTPGATFAQTLTVNLYGVDSVGNPAGSLGSITSNFDLPYRPTSTPALCSGDPQTWFSKKDGVCFHGITSTISVNFSGLHIPVPANQKLIVTVAFNTSDVGVNPIGPAACSSTSAGCPYDALNVTTSGNGGMTGSVIDTNGVYVRPAGPGYVSCPGTTLAAGVLAVDTGCWAGSHPQIEVKVNTNTKAHSKTGVSGS